MRRMWYIFETKVVWNLATVCMLLSVGIMFGEGVSRTFFDLSNWWAEELVRFLVVWAFFLALGIGHRRGHYIRTTLFLAYCPAWLLRVFNVAGCLAGMIFSATILYTGFNFAMHLKRIMMMPESDLPLPMWIIVSALPVGAFFYLVYFLGALVQVLRNEDPFENVAEN